MSSLLRTVTVFGMMAVAASLLAAGAWRIEAGPVEVIHDGRAQVSGIFQVHAPPGTPSGAAPRNGGACLVADLVPFGVGGASCRTNADCNTTRAIDTELRPELEGAFGYCAVRDGSDEFPRCWTRPGPVREYCRRSVDGLILTPGIHRLPVVPAAPLRDAPVVPEWAILACLADEGHPTACGEQNSEHQQVSVSPRPRDGR